MKNDPVSTYCKKNGISVMRLAAMASTKELPISRQWIFYHINRQSKYWPVPLAKALERATLGELRAWELISGE